MENDSNPCRSQFLVLGQVDVGSFQLAESVFRQGIVDCKREGVDVREGGCALNHMLEAFCCMQTVFDFLLENLVEVFFELLGGRFLELVVCSSLCLCNVKDCYVRDADFFHFNFLLIFNDYVI